VRAAQVIDTTGPEHVVIRDVPEPEPGPDDVLVEVHSVGVSFPDLLLTKGEYQLKPETPFTLGVDFAGTVVSGPGFEPGQRVAGVGGWGGAAELVANPADATAGGVGTATIQVAKGYDARTIAVVSTDEKAAVAKAAGADETVLLDGFKEAVGELTGGRGVDVVVDVVGGSAFTDSLRSLATQGRLLVVGFAAGQGIPEVRVNRLLLNNIDVRGVGWGAFAMVRPGYMQQQWAELLPMIESGTVKPPIGSAYDLEDFGQALVDMEARRTLGKSVVRVR
jgi:NADPH2:quinone reductase